MRISSLAPFLGASALVAGQAVDAQPKDSFTPASTYFDGKEVPPLLELTAANIDDEFKRTKYMVVKYISPHSIRFAPTYQTVYEYYYTSNPPANPGEHSDTGASTFQEYYDIQFAVLNCVAQNSICSKHGIRAYPQTVLYKNGVALDSVRGASSIDKISNLIESALEAEKPGSRPKDALLPTPGASSRPVPDRKEVEGEFPTEESQKPMVLQK